MTKKKNALWYYDSIDPTAAFIVGAVIMAAIWGTWSPRHHKYDRFAAAQCTLKHGSMVAGICISNDAIIENRRCTYWVNNECARETDRNGISYGVNGWQLSK